jgi:hypothetical protein
MNQVTFAAMEGLLGRYKGRYTAVVGIQPTGWAQGRASKAAKIGKRSQRGTVVLYQVGCWGATGAGLQASCNAPVPCVWLWVYIDGRVCVGGERCMHAAGWQGIECVRGRSRTGVHVQGVGRGVVPWCSTRWGAWGWAWGCMAPGCAVPSSWDISRTMLWLVPGVVT